MCVNLQIKIKADKKDCSIEAIFQNSFFVSFGGIGNVVDCRRLASLVWRNRFGFDSCTCVFRLTLDGDPAVDR